MEKLRVGDKIYCHTTGYMAKRDCEVKGALFAREGKYYDIAGVFSGSIEINTEYVDRHSWTIKNEDSAFYNYFLVPLIVKYSVKKHTF